MSRLLQSPMRKKDLTDAHTHRDLIIEGARQNNLKNISLRIPHNALTVITGVSGSGKSSLAFDTIFAEGQWRYIESLSSYTRMFLERVTRPDVDRLLNIRPAIALEQKNPVRTSRSTVGTASEISDYLRLLFAKIGHLICPNCHLQAEAHQPASVAQKLLEEFPHSGALILFSIDAPKPQQIPDCISSLLKRGYVRLLHHDQVLNLNMNPIPKKFTQPTLQIVVDRLVLREDNHTRLVESLETAFQEGHGVAQVQVVDDKRFSFSTSLRCPQCHHTFDTVRPIHFSFNHVLGACPECKGFGNILRYDENLIIPDPAKSLKDGVIEPWTKPSNHWWQDEMLKGFKKRKLAITTPYAKLSREEKRLLWEGEKKLEGIHQFFEYLEGKRYKMHVRVFLSRYRSPSRCPTCQGSRLRPHALMVHIHEQNIHNVSQWPIRQIHAWLQDLTLSPYEREVANDILQTLEAKLSCLLHVGLDYLTVNREMRTLSGGEAQRISLATQLGAKLVGTLYVLDEPTIGLHPRDTAALAGLLKALAKHGNTVITVEHDHQVIEQADHVIEIGPASGEQGGEVICSASVSAFMKHPHSITAGYLRGDASIPVPLHRRTGNGKTLTITGAREHNLKNLTIQIPLGTLTSVTGVSGSGKSTLVENILYAAAARAFNVAAPPLGTFDDIHGLEHLHTVRLINQEPIGKTPRSNPITYIKAFHILRQLFSQHSDAQTRGLTPAHFSFNTGAGRCPRCEGQGHEKLEMYFFEDLYVTCEDCEGRRFKPEVLAIRVQGHSIHDALSMTVEQALATFGELAPTLAPPLTLLNSLGLGYLRLGQPATSLSGGESQRLKIAAELARLHTAKHRATQSNEVLYILDEPTTGLHTEDIQKLLCVLNRLVEEGNTVVVVEHHLDVMKCSDWIIDLGPGGGEHGGKIVAEGRPEDVAQEPESYTGQFLQPMLGQTNP
ncbi:excinuclease ABC subunit UvrA [Nitrospira sp. M1]